MAKVYFEEIHKASRDYHYIDLLMNNINYVSHYHEEIEMVYMISGSTTITINGTETTLYAGDIYIIMPSEIHSFVSTETNNIYIMKFFTPVEFTFLHICGFISKNDENYKFFKDIVETIALEDTAKNNGYQYAVNIQSNILLLNIIRTLKAEKISESEKNETLKRIEFLNLVNNYLENHFTERILLSEIASYMHYSKFYFSHMFKEITSMNFIEFLTVFRLEKAKTFLSTNKSITQIALECGFNNLRSFNRSFKKYYSTTPLKYKKDL